MYDNVCQSDPFQLPIEACSISFQSLMKTQRLLPIWNMLHLLIHFHFRSIFSETHVNCFVVAYVDHIVECINLYCQL